MRLEPAELVPAVGSVHKPLAPLIGIDMEQNAVSASTVPPMTQSAAAISDAALVVAARAGDMSAFGQLVSRYQRSTVATCRAVLKDSHHSADAAQDAFIAAYRSLNSLRDPAMFGAWIITIARNRARRLGRRIRSDLPLPTMLVDLRDANSPGGKPEPDTNLLNAIAALPEQERLVIMLHYFEETDIAKIAVILDRPTGTVTKQLSRAYDRLRRRLAKGDNR
jgi:RNA polymerase sigma-70 factor, ECF subfamily